MSEKNEGNDKPEPQEPKPETQDTKPEAQDAQDPRAAARKRLNEFGLPPSDPKGDHPSETIGDAEKIRAASRAKMNQFGNPQPEESKPDRAAKLKQFNELGQTNDAEKIRAAGKSKSREQINQLDVPQSQDAGQQSDAGVAPTFDGRDKESHLGHKPENEPPNEMTEVAKEIDVDEIEGDYEWTDDKDASDAIDEMLNSNDPEDRKAVLNGYTQYWQYKEGLTEQDKGRYLRAMEIFKRQKSNFSQANLERMPVRETPSGKYKPARGYEQMAGFAKHFAQHFPKEFNGSIRVRVTK